MCVCVMDVYICGVYCLCLCVVCACVPFMGSQKCLIESWILIAKKVLQIIYFNYQLLPLTWKQKRIWSESYVLRH